MIFKNITTSIDISTAVVMDELKNRYSISKILERLNITEQDVLKIFSIEI